MLLLLMIMNKKMAIIMLVVAMTIARKKYLDTSVIAQSFVIEKRNNEKIIAVRIIQFPMGFPT